MDLLRTRQDLDDGGILRSIEDIISQRVRLVSEVLGGFQLEPEDAFLVGDSWWDIRAGKRLGIKTVLVRTGFAAFNDFSKETPDVVTSSLLELLHALEGKDWTI